MTSELKLEPCHFCGGNAILNSICFPYSIHCKDCGTSMHTDAGTEGLEDMVEAWNKLKRQFTVLPYSELKIKRKKLYERLQNERH